MILRTADELELSDAWVEGDDSAGWRPGAALTSSAASRDSITRCERGVLPDGTGERDPLD